VKGKGAVASADGTGNGDPPRGRIHAHDGAAEYERSLIGARTKTGADGRARA
jgi:hypothetical protein